MTDNELVYFESIHLFVELLDQFFGNVCETHSYDERIRTLQLLKSSPSHCSGVIFSLQSA